MIDPVLDEGVLDLENVTIEITATGERHIPDLLLFPDSAAPDDVYHGRYTIDFGDKIHLPEPFDVAIDTAQFS